MGFGMGGPAKFEVPTHQITREAFFNLPETTKTSLFRQACKTVGNFTHKLVLFPLPMGAGMRLHYFKQTPSQSFCKHLAIGTGIGLAIAGFWHFFSTRPYRNKRNDYFKQLAVANAAELEKFRLRLVDEAAERRANE